MTILLIILTLLLIWKTFQSWLFGRLLREIKKIALKQYNWEIDSDTVDNLVKTILKR